MWTPIQTKCEYGVSEHFHSPGFAETSEFGKIEASETYHKTTYTACLKKGAATSQDIFVALPGPFATSNDDISVIGIEDADQRWG